MRDRETRRKIERAFYHYENNLKIAEEYIRDQYETGITAQIGKVGHSSSVSDPTGEKAVRAMEGSQANLWCKVVDNTCVAFRWSTEHKMIQLRYFHRWGREKICQACGISERTYTYWVEEILLIAEQWALEYRLI